MFRYDLKRTGYSPSDAPDTAALGWSKKVSGAGEMWSSPAISGSRLYIGSSDGKMHCLNAATGDEIWNFNAGPFAVYSSPAIAYGMVFFGGPERQIFALPCDDPDSSGTIEPSEVIWNYTVGPSNPGPNAINCAGPAVKDGKVYIGTVDQYFYCFNATLPGPKTPVWKTYTPFRGQHAFSSSPAIDKGMIFAATGNQPGGTSSGRLYAFNETDGSRVWEFDLGDITYSSPAVYNDRVYIANSGDWIVNAGNRTYKMYCLDIDGYLDHVDDGIPDSHYGNSDLLWSYDTGRYVYSSPAVHNGKLYFGCHDGNLTCLDAVTGAKIWTCSTPPGSDTEPGGIMGSPAIAGGKVFFGTQDGRLIAVPENDPDSDGTISPGEYAWSYTLGGKVVCSPSVANGAVYIGNYQGTVFCFGTPAVPELFLLTVLGSSTIMAAACIAVKRQRKDD
jgi:outer membrane protein assembly factor BamB